jgi:hypothetical protein
MSIVLLINPQMNSQSKFGQETATFQMTVAASRRKYNTNGG